MKCFIKFFLFLAVPAVYANNSGIFEFSVDKVVEKDDLITGGTHIIGSVVSGCIHKGDTLEIYRSNQKLGESEARIVDVPGKLKSEAEEGESARIYISTDIGLGFNSADKLFSSNTSCSD